MTQFHDSPGHSHAPPVRAGTGFGSGLGSALAGHLLSVCAFYAGGALVGGYRGNSDDLEAGGRFAVGFVSLASFAVVQTVLFWVCVPVIAATWQRRRRFAKGVLVGWGAGFVAIALLVAALILRASAQSPY